MNAPEEFPQKLRRAFADVADLVGGLAGELQIAFGCGEPSALQLFVSEGAAVDPPQCRRRATRHTRARAKEGKIMVNPVKVGFVFAVFLALWHAGWSALVATGLAQKVIDFVFWMHFIKPPYQIETFDPTRAAILVGVTAGVGLVGGIVGGAIWNAFHRA